MIRGLNQQESDFFKLTRNWAGCISVLVWPFYCVIMAPVSLQIPTLCPLRVDLIVLLATCACKMAFYPHKTGPRVRREGLRPELPSLFASLGQNLSPKPPAGFPLYLFGRNWATCQPPG